MLGLCRAAAEESVGCMGVGLMRYGWEEKCEAPIFVMWPANFEENCRNDIKLVANLFRSSSRKNVITKLTTLDSTFT